MTLAEYDAAMQRVAEMEKRGWAYIKAAGNMEEKTLNDAGLEMHNRGDLGGPCWKLKDVRGYFNTPRAALEYLEAKG